MTSKITDDGLQLDGTGTTQQTKVVVSVDGEVPNASGEISLSDTAENLNTRVGNLETAQNPTNESLGTSVTDLDTRVTTLESASSVVNSIDWMNTFPTMSHTPSTGSGNWFQIDRNNHNGYDISNGLLYISTNYTWQTQDAGTFKMHIKYSPTVLSQSELASYKTDDYLWQSFSVPNASYSNWASGSLDSSVLPFWITHTDLPSENPYSSRFIYIGFGWSYSVGFSQTDLNYRFVSRYR